MATLESEILTYHPALPYTRIFEYVWAARKILLESGREPSDITVLDVGCNGGILDKYLMDKGCRVTAADIDPRGAYYWDGVLRENFAQVDCRYPPHEWHKSFDYITIISTLEHLKEDDDLLMVRNLEPCLRFGAMLITVPYGEGMKKQGRWTVKCYDQYNIDEIAKPAGLRLFSWTVTGKNVKSDIPIFCVELIRS